MYLSVRWPPWSVCVLVVRCDSDLWLYDDHWHLASPWCHLYEPWCHLLTFLIITYLQLFAPAILAERWVDMVVSKPLYYIANFAFLVSVQYSVVKIFNIHLDELYCCPTLFWQGVKNGLGCLKMFAAIQMQDVMNWIRGYAFTELTACCP